MNSISNVGNLQKQIDPDKVPNSFFNASGPMGSTGATPFAEAFAEALAFALHFALALGAGGADSSPGVPAAQGAVIWGYLGRIENNNHYSDPYFVKYLCKQFTYTNISYIFIALFPTWSSQLLEIKP